MDINDKLCYPYQLEGKTIKTIAYDDEDMLAILCEDGSYTILVGSIHCAGDNDDTDPELYWNLMLRAGIISEEEAQKYADEIREASERHKAEQAYGQIRSLAARHPDAMQKYLEYKKKYLDNLPEAK